VLPVQPVAIPSSGTLKNLMATGYLGGSTPGVTLPITITVWVNSTATALTCNATLSSGTQTGPLPSGLTYCSDSVDSAPVNAGDLVSVSMSTPSLNGSAIPNISVSVEKQ
jgi:hypothetical protein